VRRNSTITARTKDIDGLDSHAYISSPNRFTYIHTSKRRKKKVRKKRKNEMTETKEEKEGQKRK